MSSLFGRRMWLSFAPCAPELLEQTSANRLSVTPVQIAVLPPREWPTIPTRVASMAGFVSIQSITRLAAHAHAEIVPHDSSVRTSGFSTHLNTPCANPVFFSVAMSSVRKPIVA